MTKRCETCGAEIRIFKNRLGGAELYCMNCDYVPGPVEKRFRELRLSLFSQYPKTFKNLKSGIKESFNFTQKYKGFTINFSSVFD